MWRVVVTLIVIGMIASAIPLSAENVYEAWVARFNGSGNQHDVARAIASDNDGNVYVTGYSYGLGTDFDYATIKYAPNGDTIWVRRYNGSGNGTDYALSLALDDSGHVYVTGYTLGNGTGSDFTTIKYNPDGSTAWVRDYNGPANSQDAGISLGLDGNSYLYVTGRSEGTGTGVDYVTIKYAPNGDTIWVRRYNGIANGDDTVDALKVDKSGNAYVTGKSFGFGTGYDYTTIKYAPTGDTIWVRYYNGPGNGIDYARALELEDNGNVYVTGYSDGAGTSVDYATIKYTSVGDTVWVKRYNGPGNLLDQAEALKVDKNGSVYVTGRSDGSGTGYDYATIKYGPNGNTEWVKRYIGPGWINDGAYAMALADNGHLFVTGFSAGSSTDEDYATIEYSPNGHIMGVWRYNGPANYMDFARVMTSDNTGNVYVTGWSWGSGTQYDYTTIKYAACNSTSPKAGDANADGKYTLSDVLSTFNYMFHTPGCSPLPDCWLSERLCRGDWNGDGKISIVDVVQGVNYIFNKPVGGPWNPVPSVGCCP